MKKEVIEKEETLEEWVAAWLQDRDWVTKYEYDCAACKFYKIRVLKKVK